MRCLESLARDSFSGKRTVFLIDNAQSLGRSLAARLPSLDIEIDRPARNLGFAEGCARGIALALACGADFILLLNNDAVVERSCLELLVEAATDSPEAGLLSPRIVSMSRPTRPWYEGGSFSLWSGIPVQARRRSNVEDVGSPREVDYATGCAMLIRPAVVRSVGSFDARFFAYCEDLDFSLRARNAGFRILVVPRAGVQHAAPDSDRRFRSVYYSTRNLLEVMRRHGTWYHWIGMVPNFLVRWVGFFTVLACLRGRPELVRALVTGVIDFSRGRFGERAPVRPTLASRTEVPQ
jgi:GT2 family glycosyltransferase